MTYLVAVAGRRRKESRRSARREARRRLDFSTPAGDDIVMTIRFSTLKLIFSLKEIRTARRRGRGRAAGRGVKAMENFSLFHAAPLHCETCGGCGTLYIAEIQGNLSYYSLGGGGRPGMPWPSAGVERPARARGARRGKGRKELPSFLRSWLFYSRSAVTYSISSREGGVRAAAGSGRGDCWKAVTSNDLPA